jgi:DNA-binding MarR family transcriptional regulator
MNPLLGRLYGVLFLAVEPVSLDELAERVGAAKSTVSVAVRKLVDARVVRRSWRKSDRRDFYTASTDPHQMMRDLLERYVRPELEVWARVGRDAKDAVRYGDGWPADLARDVLARRFADLDAFLGVWERALATIEAETAPATPARRVPVEFT